MKVIIITGQTATGKTNLALKLAKKNQGVLINCDSRQIYKKLDIITGKDTDKKTVKFYDVIDPKESFSSFDFQKIAQPLIEKIIKSGKTPIVVGGSYFYIYHLLYQVETENIRADWKLREELGKKTVSELQKILSSLSFQCFKTLKWSDKNNPQRLIRKIEILKKLPPGSRKDITNKQLPFVLKDFYKKVDLQFIALRYKNKEDLVRAVKERTEKRVKQGAIEEVKNLLKQGYRETDPGLKTIGYQQIIKYLKGEINKEQAIEQWINKEIQYAKRQVTFMKKDPNVKWKLI